MLDTSTSKIPKPIKIYNTLDDYIFKKDKTIISYNKSTRGFKEEKDNYSLPSNSKIYEVFNIIGYIEGSKLGYIICSSQTTFVGKILSAKIFRINKFIYIPNQGNEIIDEDEKYIKMLDNFLERNPLYYSDQIDLTISILNMKKKMGTEKKSNIFKYTVSQYCWNYSMAKCFDSKGMNEFIFPVINGFFGARKIAEYGEKNDIHFILIGRKDDRRSGMRFLIRGADGNGNVANSVETEEILTFKDDEGIINICSFIELRGSIPLLWKQEPSMQLNPKIRPKDDFSENCQVFRMHIEELMENYGAVCCVNLIDQKKDQKIIGNYFNNIVQNYKDANRDKEKLLSFVWFDFHQECKKMKYENIKKLFKTKSFKECLNDYGFTHLKYKTENIEEDYQDNKIDDVLIEKKLLEGDQLQKGIFRTNCIDSLDRSNVVQSVIGRYFLFLIFSEIGFSNVKPSDDDVFRKFQGSFESTFKLLWADHGDRLSLAYSGTGALKSDFVRTGKRTLMGNLQDGYLSCKRFYLNNFRDGYNQDCHDYFLGALNPRKKEFKKHSNLSMHIFISVLLFFAYFIFSVLRRLSLPRNYEPSLKKFIFQLILFANSFYLCFLVINNYAQKMFIDFQTRYE